MACTHVSVDQTCCMPVPPVRPRVVVVVSNSRRMVDSAVPDADERNVYGDMEIARHAR